MGKIVARVLPDNALPPKNAADLTIADPHGNDGNNVCQDEVNDVVSETEERLEMSQQLSIQLPGIHLHVIKFGDGRGSIWPKQEADGESLAFSIPEIENHVYTTLAFEMHDVIILHPDKGSIRKYTPSIDWEHTCRKGGKRFVRRHK